MKRAKAQSRGFRKAMRAAQKKSGLPVERSEVFRTVEVGDPAVNALIELACHRLSPTEKKAGRR